MFATRDRYDESYDMVRATRDKRYKYIRNFYPEKPYLLWIPYRNRHPAMQEMWRLHAEDKLEGSENVMFQHPRPVEELYDLENDPYEIDNLAKNTEYRSTLERLRKALDDWRAEFGHMGEIPEEQMVRQWWPNGVQPQTAAPIFIPISNSNLGMNTASEDETLTSPAIIQLHCATQGASIAYTTEANQQARWRLYTKPLRFQEGTKTLRTKAVRIGYKESEERSLTFTVNNPD